MTGGRVPVRRLAKRVLERVATGTGAARWLARSRRADVLILAYHNVVPHGSRPQGEVALHIPQQRFAQHLDALERLAEVVPLQSILDDVGNPPPRARPRAVITFDDGYRGALTAGLHELQLRKMPATFFICPGCLGAEGYWWDYLAASHRGVLPSEIRERSLEQGRGRGSDIMDAVSASVAVRLPPHSRVADSSLVDAVGALPGVAFGGHSWSHPNLVRATPEELHGELSTTLDWLAARPSGVPVLAYPYGLESEPVQAATKAQGYTAALKVSGGWWRSPRTAGNMAIPRLNVSAGLSAEGLALRLAGFSCT